MVGNYEGEDNGISSGIASCVFKKKAPTGGPWVLLSNGPLKGYLVARMRMNTSVGLPAITEAWLLTMS